VVFIESAHFDVHRSSLGFLPQVPGRFVTARQHIVRGYRGMSDESGLRAGGEEPGSHIVIVVFGREDEGGIRIVELACDGEHLRFSEPVRVQHDACRVAREALASERIDLVDLDLPRHHFLFRHARGARF
jgi:hypothetical protein